MSQHSNESQIIVIKCYLEARRFQLEAADSSSYQLRAGAADSSSYQLRAGAADSSYYQLRAAAGHLFVNFLLPGSLNRQKLSQNLSKMEPKSINN